MSGAVAILGASGQLGSALVEAFAGRALLTPSHAELDVEGSDAVAAFLDAHRPSVLINCTAFHNVPDCERLPERAFAVNALAVDRLAERCAARDVAFATISTDYVFDGRATAPYRTGDRTGPLNAYGVSKLAGEQLVPRHGGRWFVFRTAGVYGRSGTSNKGYTFIERVIRAAEAGEPVRVVTDMTFSPSYAPHVARAMRDAIDAGVHGVHHAAGAGACTWYDFARYAFDRLGLGAIEAVTTAAFAAPVRRPMYSALADDTLAPAGIAPVPAWQAGVDAYLAARRERLAAAGTVER